MATVAKIIIGSILYALLLHVLSLYQQEIGLVIQITNEFGYPTTMLMLGGVMRFVNRVVRYAISILTIPLSIITLGISTIIVNIALLYVFTFITDYIQIGVSISLGNIIQIIILSIIISIANVFIKIIS